ncbi:hypothetical protein D3C83_286020 [compost metagenome]
MAVSGRGGAEEVAPIVLLSWAKLTVQWMPHSFGTFASHHQRPARMSSPGPVGRVQGAQPMLV